MGRQRDAARLVPDHQQRRLHRRVRHLLRPPQRLHLPRQSHRGLPGSADHRRRQPESRLESRLGRAHGPLRRRLDGRDGDSLPVAPLPARTRPGMGHPVGPGHPVELRGGVPDGGADLGRAGTVPPVGRRHPGGPGGAGGQPHVRDQALRDRLAQHGPDRRAPDLERRATGAAASTSSTASPRT